MRRRNLVWAVTAAVAGLLVPSAALAHAGARVRPHRVAHHPAANRRRAALACTGNPNTVHRLVVPLAGDRGFDVSGEYVLPRGKPKGMVVFAHGHGHSILSWTWILQHVAASDGYITLAMEYPGTTYPDKKNRDATYGWRVREGAAESIRAAQLIERSCPGLKTIVDYGVSMGGNSSGLMAEAGAKRANGKPLFDLWFDIEGVTNLTEEYMAIRGVAKSGSAAAITAQAEIEAEAGGAYEKVPAAYDALTVVNHADQILASGIRGVVMVHAVDDGLVPYNQDQELGQKLLGLGIPTEAYAVGSRAPGSDPNDTTIDGYVPVPHPEPLAGHGFEGSHSQTVILTSLNLLDATLQGKLPWPQAYTQHFVDGTLGQLF